jgi:molybdopterin converting factor small subunit
VPLNFALRIRNENRLVGFRTYLRDFWNKIRREDQTEDQLLTTIQEFRDNLGAQYQQFKQEFDEVRKSVVSKIAVAGVSGAGAILSGQLGLGIFPSEYWLLPIRTRPKNKPDTPKLCRFS